MGKATRDSLGIGDMANLLVEDDGYVVGLGYQLMDELGVTCNQ